MGIGVKHALRFPPFLAEVLQVWSKEQDSYKASSRDRGLTLKVVKKAKSIVEGFYKSKDLTAFSQEDASPPKVTWKLGSSRNGNLGSSVIAMLDTIVEDFQKEQKDADAAEEKAEEELAKVRAWAVAPYLCGQKGMMTPKKTLSEVVGNTWNKLEKKIAHFLLSDDEWNRQTGSKRATAAASFFWADADLLAVLKFIWDLAKPMIKLTTHSFAPKWDDP